VRVGCVRCVSGGEAGTRTLSALAEAYPAYAAPLVPC